MGATGIMRRHAVFMPPNKNNINKINRYWLFHFLFELIFEKIVNVLGSFFELHLWWFSIFVALFLRAWFLYRYFIDFKMDFSLIFNVFVDTFSVRTCNLLNHQKYLFCNEFQCFYHWHWFSMSCGIDFGSILGPLWHQIPCLLVIVFWMNSFL